MDEQKRTRLAAAVTVNVILLVAILVVVLIYQLATVAAVRGKVAETKSEIEKYEQLIEEGEDQLKILQSEKFLLQYAMQELHYVFPSGD